MPSSHRAFAGGGRSYPGAAAGAVPASPLRRVVTAAGSALLLLGLVVGLPVALALLAGNPLPGDASVDGLRSALTSPDDGTLFLSVLTVVGWLAWASFAGSVALEVFARLTRRKAPAIPGLGGPQRLASLLVTAVAAVAFSPTVASASAAVVDTPPPAAVTLFTDQPAAGRDRGPAPAVPADLPEQVRHVVGRGEALLDLQDRYGVPWQRIAEANYGVEQPDGRSLQRGQTRIYPGWQLRIPTSVGPLGAADSDLPRFGVPAPAVDTAAPTPLAEMAVQETGVHQQYEVVRGDWMWYIAERFLGDPERYRDIAALNPQYADRHGDFPDHIEAGWTLALPEDAVDRGPIGHATGETVGPPAAAAPAPSPDPPPPEPPPPPPAPDPPPAEAAPAPPDRAGLGEAPGSGPAEKPAAEEPVVDHAGLGSAPEDADPLTAVAPDLERLAPAALAGAGLLTALVFGAAAFHQRRRHQHHRTGFRFASPPARRLEKALRVAQQPLDVARLDAALRALAAGLADRAGPLSELAARRTSEATALPDVAGAMVDSGSVHLLLAAPCPNPPAPWRDHGDRWTLPAGLALPAVAGDARLAPLPTLAAIGSQAGVHLLLDLERLGFVTLHGDSGRAMDLLRYLAAELAGHTWADTSEILVAGFPSVDTKLLVALNPERIHAVPSIPDAVVRVRQRLASARATLAHTGAPDAFAGRVTGVVGDAWMPQILLAAAQGPADLAALAALERELDGAARCAVAVATTDATAPPPDQWRVTVTPDGVVHVRLPFLRASLAAAALSTEELRLLAEATQSAQQAPQVPVPPAPEPDPWAAGTDAAGALPQPGPGGAAGGWFAPADPPTHASVTAPNPVPAGPAAAPSSAPIPAPAPAPVPSSPPVPVPASPPPAAVPSSPPVAVPSSAPPVPVPSSPPVPVPSSAPPGAVPSSAPPAPMPAPAPAPVPVSRADQDPRLDDDLAAWRADHCDQPRIAILGPVSVDAPGAAPATRRRLHAELIVFLAQRAGRGADAGQIDAALWPDTRVTDAARQQVIGRTRHWLGTAPDGTPWLPDVGPDLTYRLADGYLFDWHLFRRLRTRADSRGDAGAADLQAALGLLRGAPLDGADQPPAPGVRNPFPWLAESDIHPSHLVASVVDTAHQLAERCLAVGDPDGARWAVQQAWLADRSRSYDQPWRDLLRAEQADGQTGRLRMVLAELMEVRDAETLADLAPETHRLVSCWPSHVLAPAGAAPA